MTLKLSIRLDREDFKLDVAFTVPPGVTALYGPSGAGKTTVAKAIAGTVTPDRGRIVVGDRVLFHKKERIDLPLSQRRVGMVFQDARLFPHMDVARNLAYGGPIRSDLIDVLGIGHLLDRRPATLSGGETQRVALARALFSNPDVLVLDEPLAALDAPRKAAILPWLDRLRIATSLPMLYISHAADEVARLADRIVVLEQGKVSLEGPLNETLADPALVPLIGQREAGAVLRVRVLSYSDEDELTTLATAQGTLTLPGKLGNAGDLMRIRVLAQDVILARTLPRGISALNILPVIITAVHQGHGPGVAVGLASGADRLLARITRRSARMLKLHEGMALYAIIKATAVAPSDVSGVGFGVAEAEGASDVRS